MKASWEEVKSMIQELVPEENKDISLETHLFDDLDLDSLCIMGLLTDIEEKYGVDFTDLDDFAERFVRCDLLLEGINELLEKREQNASVGR